jgi:hypothetical protein
MHTVWPGAPLGLADGRFISGWRLYYDVDISEYPLHLNLRLPSSNDALEFECGLHLVWRVHDPQRVVMANLHDVRSRVAMELESKARPVTWELDPHESKEAEQRLNKELGRGETELTMGVTISNVYGRVRPPDLRRVNVEKDEQQTFDINRIDSRYAFYRARFAEGHEALLALSIQNQSDVSVVVNMLMQHGHQRAARSLEAFKAMLQEGRVEDFELEGIRKATLENMVDLLQYRLGGPGALPGSGRVVQGGEIEPPPSGGGIDTQH